jgi:DNA polymerase III epsilon subunit-like protein
MKRLYYDTETTGFPAKAGAPLAECPHIVQLAAAVIDDDEGKIASFSVIIQPEGWEVSEGAAAIHGITTEKAAKLGIQISVAILMFSHLCKLAEQAVAHNGQFDEQFIDYEIRRLGQPNRLMNLPRFCTMQATTDICQLPGKYGRYKWPKLIEAHEHFFGEGFDGAHDALADVLACARIHQHLIKNNLI